jgi:hypothetical protein
MRPKPPIQYPRALSLPRLQTTKPLIPISPDSRFGWETARGGESPFPDSESARNGNRETGAAAAAGAGDLGAVM